MAKYVGETIRISVTARDFDNETVLESGDVDEVELTIYELTGAEVQQSAMTWSADNEHWFYDWDTDAVDAGTYRLKVRVATGSTENWEFGRVQLKNNPV